MCRTAGELRQNPQFHRQMVYAVAMRTIQHFEEALGRVALWSPRRVERNGAFVREDYVQRLKSTLTP